MHAEIHLTQNGADQRVILDGQDITRHVLQAGFSIELTEVLNAHNGDLLAALPVIRMTIRPDTIDVTGDLAAAIELARTEAEADLVPEAPCPTCQGRTRR